MDIDSHTSPRTIARTLDRLGIDYYPADLVTREIRDPDDQPQEIETVTTGRGIGGLKLHRDDEGWTWFNRRTRSSGSLDSVVELEEQLSLA